MNSLSTTRGPQAPEQGKHCARGGTRTGFQPLNIRHSPENLRNPAQSGTSTTRSEAQGVHIVHTLLLLPASAPQPGCLDGGDYGSLIGDQFCSLSWSPLRGPPVEMNRSFSCAHPTVDSIKSFSQRWKAVMESRVWSYSRGSAGMPGSGAYRSAARTGSRVSRRTVRQALAAADHRCAGFLPGGRRSWAAIPCPGRHAALRLDDPRIS